jgi:hypothetical protein
MKVASRPGRLPQPDARVHTRPAASPPVVLWALVANGMVQAIVSDSVEVNSASRRGSAVRSLTRPSSPSLRLPAVQSTRPRTATIRFAPPQSPSIRGSRSDPQVSGRCRPGRAAAAPRRRWLAAQSVTEQPRRPPSPRCSFRTHAVTKSTASSWRRGSSSTMPVGASTSSGQQRRRTRTSV